MGRSRLPELDVLRFGAAASVLVFHYCVLVTIDTPFKSAVAHIAQFGFLGVPLFFMISGFVIFWTAFSKTPREFVLARFTRLYPSYWICVLITSGMFALSGDPRSLPTIAANLTMVQQLFGVPSIDQVYWTLFIELKFYALVLILMLCHQLPRIERWLGAWLALTAASLLAGVWHRGAIAGLDTVVFEGSAACFTTGAFAYLIRSSGSTAGRWIGFAASSVLSLFAAFRMQYHYTHMNDSLTLVWVACFMLVAQAVFVVIALQRQGLPAWPVWRWLGSLTYPLYLLHAMAGKLLYAMMPATWPEATRLSLTVAAVLTTTVILAVTIEQHGCNALFRKLAGRARRPVPIGPLSC